MFGPFTYYLWRRRRGYRPGNGRFAGVLRVAAYALGVGVVAGAFSLRSALANVGEATDQIGQELMPLADVLGEHTQIRLNGESVFVGNALSKQDTPQVLDRFQQYCHENRADAAEGWSKIVDIREQLSGLTKEQLEKMPEKNKLATTMGKLVTVPVDRFGTIRTGDGNGGSVMCFVKTDGSIADAREAFEEFQKTGELSKVGALRYAYVERTKQGHSHVLTAWTDKTFNLGNVYSGSEGPGDAPGEDSANVPRPPQSRRILTAAAENTPYGLRIYESTAHPEEILAFYDAKMDAAGWTVLRPTGEDRATERGYMMGAIQVGLTTRPVRNVTHVTLGELGRR